MFVIAALAIVPRASAAAFASTSMTASDQTLQAGDSFSVAVVFAVGSYQTYGINTAVSFDASKLQVTSVTNGATSPFANVTTSTFNNTAGTISFQATGGTVSNTSFVAVTYTFTATAAGTAAINFSNVNQYIANYGPYGVNGAATGTSVSITNPAPVQTLTLLGGAGNTGDVVANVEYYNPATGSWQPAYLAYFPGHSNHPWGVINGTNHWINYKANGTSDPGAGGPSQNINGTFWYLYRVRFTVPADATDAQMTFSLKADNLAQVAINGIAAGGSTVTVNGAPTNNVITGTTDQFNADAVFATAVHPGENTITINVGDFGGLNGFNFRIDLSMRSTEPLEVVEPETDSTPPVITPPAAITAEATSAAGASVSFTATAVDAEDGPVTVVAIPASGSTFPLGTTIVDLGASDAAGNIATASFTVNVVDTTPPVISAPANLTLEAASAAGAVATFAATAHDTVAGSVSVVSVPVSGSTFPLGTSIVDLGAADNFNNMASASFTVTVRDTIAPALTLPASQVLEATSAAGATATFSASATDAVGVTSLTYSHASGSTFALGATTVAVTATDAAGNSSSGSFTVTVVDTTAPAITSVTPSAGVLWPPNHKMVPISVVVASSDNTGVSDIKVISVTSNEPDNGLGDGDTANDTQITGPLSVNLRAERSGKGNGRIYTITVQVTDAHGNASTSTCTVSVPKSQGKGK